MLAGANGSSTGADPAGALHAGAETGATFIGLLDGAETIDAVVDAHLIIFTSAVGLFACNTNSLFPVKSNSTSSSASCPIEIAILTAFLNHGSAFNLSNHFLESSVV